MVVAGDDEHAAMRRGAVGVAVLEGVARAVDAGALAVPHGEDALDLGAGVGLDLLRAEHGGGGEVLVDGGQELDAGRRRGGPCTRQSSRSSPPSGEPR